MALKSFIPIAFIALTALSGCGQASQSDVETIVKIEMNLSAFGVESDNFPSIYASIDFAKDTSICMKSYYNPSYEGSTYSLNKAEMADILDLLEISDIQKLNPTYKEGSRSDLPSSKTVIYTTRTKYVISDYGLVAEHPLKELYKIVYKF